MLNLVVGSGRKMKGYLFSDLINLRSIIHKKIVRGGGVLTLHISKLGF
jgi:hypothetical protein